MIPHILQPTMASALTSSRTRTIRYGLAELSRRLQRRPLEVFVYLRLDDPYSLLVAQILPELMERFDVQIRLRIIRNLASDMYPDRERLARWAVRDTRYVAKLYDLVPPGEPNGDAETAHLCLAERALKADLLGVKQLMIDWWTGHDVGRPDHLSQAQETLAAGEAALRSSGHYLSATFHYGGEWYWGLDRLDHLERRWIAEGQAKHDAEAPRFMARHNLCTKPPIEPSGSEPLIIYWSARSPYAYLVLERAYRLAEYYGVEVDLRPVLPMVMRNLSVPRTKRFYILLDAKREAEVAGVPLGRICDPLGEGIERCYAVFDYAKEVGQGPAFALAFATAVWSQGVNAATDRGLSSIARSVGLDWTICKTRLNQTTWRDWAERHRGQMLDAGFWGVPILKYGDIVVWGQDRLWVIEAAMRGEPIAASSEPDSLHR